MSKITLIALGVSDLAKSVAFYRDQAGFELQNQMEEFAFFSAGPIMLMLNAGLRRPDGPLAGAMEMIVPVESVTARIVPCAGLGSQPRLVRSCACGPRIETGEAPGRGGS